MQTEIQGQVWNLLPEKCMIRPSDGTLLVSDLHLGKISHFRKAGIAVPSNAALENLYRLDQVIQNHQPKRIIILGDLFHSDINQEWVDFQSFVRKYDALKFILVKGNHDLFLDKIYLDAGLQVYPHYMMNGDFCFIHDPYETIKEKDVYLIGGHIHPGVKLVGKGKQSMRMPCFFQGEDRFILPAFGSFTGLHIMDIKAADRVFGIVANKVLKIS